MSHPCWVFASTLGNWAIAWSAQGVRLLRPVSEAPLKSPERVPFWVIQAVTDIRAHFSGRAQDLASIPVDASVFTPFQKKVAEVLRASVPGQTLTYGELAFRAGRPGAARAVGQAVRRNPVLVLVPCHRVISAAGPGGWSAFGSPDIKERLLKLEQPNNRTDVTPLP